MLPPVRRKSRGREGTEHEFGAEVLLGSPTPTTLTRAAITTVCEATRDLFLAQRFARHARPLTATVYTHPSDLEMWHKVKALNCWPRYSRPTLGQERISSGVTVPTENSTQLRRFASRIVRLPMKTSWTLGDDQRF